MIIFFLFTSAEEKKDKTAKMVPANYSALFYSDEYCFSIEWRRTMGGSRTIAGQLASCAMCRQLLKVRLSLDCSRASIAVWTISR